MQIHGFGSLGRRTEAGGSLVLCRMFWLLVSHLDKPGRWEADSSLLHGAHLCSKTPAVAPDLPYVKLTDFWRIILAQEILRPNYCNGIGVLSLTPWKNPVITMEQQQRAHIARWQNSCVMNAIQKHLPPAQTHSVRASSMHLSRGVRSDTWDGWLSTHPPTSSQGFSLPSRSGYRVHWEPWK